MTEKLEMTFILLDFLNYLCKAFNQSYVKYFLELFKTYIQILTKNGLVQNM